MRSKKPTARELLEIAKSKTPRSSPQKHIIWFPIPGMHPEELAGGAAPTEGQSELQRRIARVSRLSEKKRVWEYRKNRGRGRSK